MLQSEIGLSYGISDGAFGASRTSRIPNRRPRNLHHNRSILTLRPRSSGDEALRSQVERHLQGQGTDMISVRDISETYQRHIRNISETYQRHIRDISETYRRHIRDVSETYQRHIRDISETYQRHIRDISETYQRHIRDISETYQRHIRDISQQFDIISQTSNGSEVKPDSGTSRKHRARTNRVRVDTASARCAVPSRHRII